MARSGERRRATSNRAVRPIGLGAPSLTAAVPPHVDEQHEQLEQLYRHCAGDLERYARSKVGVQASEEIVQESFTLLYRAMTKGMRIDNPPGYLMGIADRVIAKHYAEQPPIRTLPEQFDHAIRVQDHGKDHADDTARRLDLDRVKKQQLTARQRQVASLRYDEDLLERDIAARLGITRGGVSSHLNQINAALERRLRGYEAQEGRRECL